MSSNIRIERRCQECGKLFVAMKTTTRYCSLDCGRKAYKKRKRAEKLGKAAIGRPKGSERNPITQEELSAKLAYSVREAAFLMGCSKRTVYRLIEEGKLQAENIGSRMTRITRANLLILLRDVSFLEPVRETEDYYSLDEVRAKYQISDKGLHQLIGRNSIPKMKIGWHTYVPKQMIDNLFTT